MTWLSTFLKNELVYCYSKQQNQRYQSKKNILKAKVLIGRIPQMKIHWCNISTVNDLRVTFDISLSGETQGNIFLKKLFRGSQSIMLLSFTNVFSIAAVILKII